MPLTVVPSRSVRLRACVPSPPKVLLAPARKGASVVLSKSSRTDPRGEPATGRIARLLVGQSRGFIRLGDDQEVFFHRSDLRDGMAFNDLRVGDIVTFELFEDPVSGARALRVAQPANRR